MAMEGDHEEGMDREAAALERLKTQPIERIVKASDRHMAELYPLSSRFTPEKYLASCLEATNVYKGTLFEKEDPVMKSFEELYTRIPKLYPTVDGLVSVSYSFVTGKDAAVNRGTDVVYYYDPKKPESITGLCRFGLKASSIILPSYNYAATAHGGVVEAVLDDITGTVVRHCVSIWMATSDFTAKLRKPCPLMETLKFEATVESTAKGGLYSIVSGKIFNVKGEVIATGSAKMVDTLVLARMMKS